MKLEDWEREQVNSGVNIADQNATLYLVEYLNQNATWCVHSCASDEEPWWQCQGILTSNTSCSVYMYSNVRRNSLVRD